MNTERKTYRIPAVLLTEMEECVQTGPYAHASEFVREAIREKVAAEKGDRGRRPTHPHAGGGSR